MKWSKKLTRTDAQQPTNGRLVNYLRFIRGKNPHNNQIWFKQTFFGSQSWGSGFHGKHVVEECTVPVEVIFDGKGQGFRNFRITHDDTRQDNNNTPNSWLHYDAALIADLQAKNMTGKSATIERLSSGSYRLTVG